MAFFDGLGKSISEKGKEAAKKAKDITEILQLKNQLNTEKNIRNEAYAKIGKLFYDEYQPSPPDAAYSDLFEKVSVSRERIRQLEGEINTLEGVRVCGSCGKRVGNQSSFCGNCGLPFVEAEVNPEVVVEFHKAEDVEGEELVDEVIVETIVPANEELSEEVTDESIEEVIEEVIEE